MSCWRRYLSQVFPLPGAEARAVSLPGAAFSLGAPRHQEIFSLCSASLLSCTEQSGSVQLSSDWLYLTVLQDHLPVHGPAWHMVDISRVDPPLRQGLRI